VERDRRPAHADALLRAGPGFLRVSASF